MVKSTKVDSAMHYRSTSAKKNSNGTDLASLWDRPEKLPVLFWSV